MYYGGWEIRMLRTYVISPIPFFSFDLLNEILHLPSLTVGSLSNDDGDVNESGLKAIGLV